MNKIVEAIFRTGDRCVPVGLVNIKQALEMSESTCFEFSHPAHEAGRTDIFVTRDMLLRLTSPDAADASDTEKARISDLGIGAMLVTLLPATSERRMT